MTMETFRPDMPLTRGITLLEASAGTGKTYNIANLFVRLIAEQELSIDEILVVTYTRAATAELRDRLRLRVGDALGAVEAAAAGQGQALTDPVLAKLVADGHAEGTLVARANRLRAAREGFDEANISTIHGFCQRMLQRNAFESGVELDGELVQDPSELLEEVTGDHLTEQLSGATVEWVEFLQDVGVDRACLLDVARRVEAEPDAWVIPELSGKTPEELVKPCRDALCRFVEQWRSEDEGKDDVVALLKTSKLFSRTAKGASTSITKHVESWFDEGALPPGNFPSPSPKWHTYFSAARVAAVLEEAGQEPLAHPVLDRYDELLESIPLVQCAFEVAFASHARTQLAERKQTRNMQTFDDLLRRLRAGLLDEGDRPAGKRPLREAIRRQLRAALIDEFQDTDPVQWDIFREIFGDGEAWLYLIGDPKQAIYGFRGADVFAYLDAKDAARSGQLTLDTNWRSDGRLVTAFGKLLGRDGVFAERGIEYVDVEAAPPHRADRLRFARGPRPPLELVFVERQGLPPGAVGRNGLILKGWMNLNMPLLVARDVVRCLKSAPEIVEGGTSRPIGPGDVAVLTRTNFHAADVQAALLRAGVPAVIHSAGSVLETAEAVAVQRLLDAMAHPASSGAAASALATPLIGCTARQIDEMPEDDWERWVEQLRDWHESWCDDGLMPTLRRVFASERVPERLLALEGGERAMTNVLHLAELLHTAETGGSLHPAALCDWLRSRRASGDEDSDAAQLRLESDADAVQVVTTHRSKGLQYPVCFCPTLWDGQLFRSRGYDKRHLRFHDREQGNRLTLDLHLNHKAPPKSRHVEIAARERRTEGLRLLYVALTRARHRSVVYWGAVSEGETSPLAFVLHPGGGADPAEQLALAEERFAELTDEQLLAELQQAVDRSEETIGLRQERGAARLEPYEVEVTTVATPRPRSFERAGLDRAWRRGSYSSLVRGAAAEAAEGSPEAEGMDYAPDEPEGDEAHGEPAAAIPAAAPDVPLARFPAGTDAGILLHRIFEVADFRDEDPKALDRVIAEQLPRHGMDPAAWGSELAAGLRACLQTPLGGAAGELRLADVPRGDRLDELRFDLPVAGGYAPTEGGALRGQDLHEVFAAHGGHDGVLGSGYLDRLAQLSPPPLRGFLTGAIDLVFRAEVEGRTKWFLADYKSNRLGEPPPGRSTAYHYHLGAMGQQMAHHHYFLQYHLYCVALHRYLRWRLGQGYDWDEDVGGVYYLFFRGMVGKGSPRDEQGRVSGVFFDKPSGELITALSRRIAAPRRGGVS